MYSKIEGYSFPDEFGNIHEVSCTYKLQMQSLLNFARKLGFVQVVGSTNFRWSRYGKTAYTVVSFNKMVRWHNTRFMPQYHHGVERELPNQSRLLRLPQDNMQKAIDSRLVKQVHLQASKGKNNRKNAVAYNVEASIIVQSHLIKFA